MSRILSAILLPALASAEATAYTDNPICQKNNCINPVFPALEDLHKMEKEKWFCTSIKDTRLSMGFCRAAVYYDFAVPSPDKKDEENLEALVRKQDRAANTAFVYHLAGMGKEGWDYPKPEESDDECVKAVWKMVCNSYFPRAKADCTDGQEMKYIRPCKNACENYISACKVECCDNSVQCVFEHRKQLSSTNAITQRGYSEHDGPSTLCTGAAGRSHAPGVLSLLILLVTLPFGSAKQLLQAARQALPARSLLSVMLLVAVSMMLPRADAVIVHEVANWRAEEEYLAKFQFIPPGSTAAEARMNSCAVPGLAPTNQCSGHGSCRSWESSALTNPTKFCKCDTYWADPECRTERKSQAKTWGLAIFAGLLGADRFYLGLYVSGFFKFVTLTFGLFFWVTELLITGSAPITKSDIFRWEGIVKIVFFLILGGWYFYDIIRVGSAPVPTNGFKTAADLPHFVFVFSTVFFACFVGFTFAYFAVVEQISQRRKNLWLQWASEESLRSKFDEGVLAGSSKNNSAYGALEDGESFQGSVF
jgi:TM2 domain-containing membrane protein YozV